MRVMYCLIQMWMTAAQADPTADLAPGPRELGETQAELESRLLEAEAIERAVARLQSAFASTPPLDETCRDPIRGPYAVRLRLFARAWHDAAQRVRVQASRVERIAAAPTVAPIVDVDRRALVDDLLARSHAQESGWLELVAWVDKSLPEVCDDLEITTSSGVPDPIIRGSGEKMGPVALIAINPGYVCAAGAKEGIAADGRVMIVTGPTCWSDQRWCPCEPAAVNPGAILGPLPPPPEPEPEPEVPSEVPADPAAPVDGVPADPAAPIPPTPPVPPPAPAQAAAPAPAQAAAPAPDAPVDPTAPVD